MKQEPQDDLDRLLGRAAMPKAPAWFEARLMARMRRELSQPPVPWWKRFAWILSLGTAAVVMVVVVLSWNTQISGTFVSGTTPQETNIAIHSPSMKNIGGYALAQKAKEEKVMAALSAFASYQEDNQVWSDNMQ